MKKLEKYTRHYVCVCMSQQMTCWQQHFYFLFYLHTKHEMHISWSTSNTDSSSHIDISNEYIFSSLDEAQRQMELLKHAMYAVYNPVFV